jgi:hypothetical protein
MRIARTHLFATLIALAWIAGCSSSEPPNGTLKCGTGDHPCPEGYECVARTNTCWKDGIDLGADAGGVSPMDLASPIDVTPGETQRPADVPVPGEAGSSPEVGSTISDTAPLGGKDGEASDVGQMPDSKDGEASDTSGVQAPDGKDAEAPGGEDAAASDGDSDSKDAGLLADSKDAELPADSKDAGLPDVSQPDLATPDTNAPDAPVDTGPTCPPPNVLCNGACIGPSDCCTANDCSGACATCGVDHVCATVKGMDDPTGRCAGTCDATGVCKSKQGQACQATAGGCVSGSICADGFCCNRACTATCEACDVAGALGTCTTLTSGAPPRATRTACAGAGTACAGTCNGTSPNCFYTTAACGTASCPTSTTYQAAGVCNQGTCDMPAVTTCPNVCMIAAGGCAGECQPATRRCEPSTGVPQVCNSQGAWENQAACQNGFTCTIATGLCTTCNSPKTACSSTACVDLQSDAGNCGACGHDCLGGLCSLGKCQPVAVTGTLSSSATLFGIDSNWLYFDQPSSSVSNSYDAYRVDKSHVGDNGTRVFTASAQYDVPTRVLGNEIFISDTNGIMWGFIVGSSTAKIPLARNDWNSPLPGWHSSPTYYVQLDPDWSSTLSFAWYSQANAEVGAHAETAIEYAGYNDFYQMGDQLFWIRIVNGGSAADGSGLYTASRTSAKTAAPTRLAGGDDWSNMRRIIDVNAVSVILFDFLGTNGSYYYRVPLSGGNGTDPPTGVNVVMPAPVTNATEDSNGFYWTDGDGNVNRCAPANCQATNVPLATGQSDNEHPLWGFYQDSTALYWGRTLNNQIVRVAK